MTTELAVVQQLRNTLNLPERDRGAAEPVAAGLRDAKVGNTRRVYTSAWQQFRTWAEAGGHPALPASPQAVALYLGHLASSGRSIATVQQARSAFSHFHAAASSPLSPSRIYRASLPSRNPPAEAEVRPTVSNPQINRRPHAGWRAAAPCPR